MVAYQLCCSIPSDLPQGRLVLMTPRSQSRFSWPRRCGSVRVIAFLAEWLSAACHHVLPENFVTSWVMKLDRISGRL
jgi:hypothetical protein